MLSSAEKKKSAEILGKTIESAEVHYTFCDVEFRRTIGLNTKFRWFFFSADVRHTICVVEFRRKTKKNIVRKKNCKRSRGTGLQKFRRFFFFSRSQVHNLCSGVPPTDKVRKKIIATDQGAQAPKSSAEKKKISRSQDVSCPIIGRNGKKVHKVRNKLLKNFRFRS